MTLVDTSVWIDHFRRADPWLVELLRRESVLCHAFVIGELACGQLPDRGASLRRLHQLPQANLARPTEVMGFIEDHKLAGNGIGYVDAHLLAAASLTPPARLWTGDRRLDAVARRLGLAMRPDA